MFKLDELWRWFNDEDGDGMTAKLSHMPDESREKLTKKYGTAGDKFIVWLWINDDYFDKNTPDILDIYG